MRHLVLDDVLDAHKLLTANDSDGPTLGNPGPIHSALERAAWGPFAGQGDLAERAAFIVRGIAQDHPFTNGNARAAFAAAEAFLQLNGKRIEAPADDVVEFMLAVAKGELDLEEIAAWLHPRLTKL